MQISILSTPYIFKTASLLLLRVTMTTCRKSRKNPGGRHTEQKHVPLTAASNMDVDSGGQNDDETDPERQSIPHPWPYLKELFNVVGSKNDSWRMRCVLCQPKNHELLAFKNSPSNLKKHVQVSTFLDIELFEILYVSLQCWYCRRSMLLIILTTLFRMET